MSSCEFLSPDTGLPSCVGNSSAKRLINARQESILQKSSVRLRHFGLSYVRRRASCLGESWVKLKLAFHKVSMMFLPSGQAFPQEGISHSQTEPFCARQRLRHQAGHGDLCPSPPYLRPNQRRWRRRHGHGGAGGGGGNAAAPDAAARGGTYRGEVEKIKNCLFHFLRLGHCRVAAAYEDQ